MCLLLVHSFSLAIGIAHAHGLHVQQTYGVATTSAASHTRSANYDDAVLAPLPNPSPTSFAVRLQTGAVHGLSMSGKPFTPSPSTSDQRTVRPVHLLVAETLGLSDQSQILDLQMNGGNELTPGYAIYENGQPARVALINVVDDNSGASDYTASISVGGAVPSHVRVKYLSTSGDALGSDGRPLGVVDVQTVQCDQTNHVCDVNVPAPGAALVFLSDQEPATTVPTTDWTELYTTATVDPAMLTTSNDIPDVLTVTGQGGAVDGTSLALSSLGALVAVCAFVCIESLLSYAVTGKTPFRSLSDMTKNKNAAR